MYVTYVLIREILKDYLSISIISPDVRKLSNLEKWTKTIVIARLRRVGKWGLAKILDTFEKSAATPTAGTESGPPRFVRARLSYQYIPAIPAKRAHQRGQNARSLRSSAAP